MILNKLLRKTAYWLLPPGIKHLLKQFMPEQNSHNSISAYLRSGRRPWSQGYGDYKGQYIQDVLSDNNLMKTFREGNPLPAGYGLCLDERTVVIPWALARLSNQAGRLLDAGSSLNHEFVIRSSALANMKTTIITLAPEGVAFWNLGVSYIFGDLRNLDFRDELFDTITCISTVEHIGMDNSIHAGSADAAKSGNPNEFLIAIGELKRVLKSSGVLYITFPFGQYQNFGWFQQFDSQLLDLLVDRFDPRNVAESIFRYEPDGWKLSNRSSCNQCQYPREAIDFFEGKSVAEYPPYASAGAAAVACLELKK
jgi:SAM-dependent methyltransferase